jgi:hypothetical protein
MSTCSNRSTKPAQEFVPGDRVRDPSGREVVVGIVGSQHDNSWAIWMACTLVSRPVYPEPNETAICLTEAAINALPCSAFGSCSCEPFPMPVCAAIDRAREASR